MSFLINHTEGEPNTSAARRDWLRNSIGPQSAPLLARDSEVFLHQALSTPCVSTIAKAEGYMDFHGNSVHHIGYGHPRLVAAIKAQLDDLSFAPRRFTNEPAVELAEKLGQIAPGDLNKVLFTTGGSDANEVALKIARAATGRFKTVSFWDAYHGAGCRWRSNLSQPYRRAVDAGRRTCGAFRLLSLPLQSRGARGLRAGLRTDG